MQVESYLIKSEGIDLRVSIEQVEDEGRRYNLKIPEVEVATRALLEQVKRKLITDVSITTGEILNPEEAEKTKEKFKSKAETLIKESLPNIEEDSKRFLIAILMHEMVGLGDVEFLLNDINLEEIILTSANEAIRVYHRKYGWLKTNLNPKSEAEIQNIANIIARRVGRQITILTPLLDAHLITGDRANAVLYPISTKGNTITIRKFTRDPWTIVDLIKNKTCPSDVYALIWLGMQYEASIMISGGTASGKTTLLSTIMPFIPPNHRIISIEQTRELMLPDYLYWCPLVTRLPNPENKGEVCMYPGSYFINGKGELIEISQYIEEKLAKKSKKLSNNLIIAQGDGDTLLAGDPLSLRYRKEKIKAYTKNLNRKYICEIICSDGTKFRVTENTKIPVLSSEGKLRLLNPFEIKKLNGKVHLPLFTKLNVDSSIQEIKLFDIFDKNDVYAYGIKKQYLALENNLRKRFLLKELALKFGVKRQSFSYYRKSGVVNMHILKSMIKLSDYSLDYFEKQIKYLKGKGGSANLVEIPRELNEDLAYFAGFILAEKFINKNRITITQKEDIGYILNDLVKNLFAIEIKHSKDVYNKYSLFSSVISYLMKDLFNADKSKNIRIPKIIMRSPNKIIAAFLAGYIDGDGSVDKGRVCLSSINKDIINEFRYLFTRLGIKSSIYSYLHKNRVNKIYTLNISYRKDLLNAYSLLKFKKLSNIEKSKTNLKKQFKEGTIRDRIPASWAMAHIRNLKNYLTKSERYNFYYRYKENLNKTISRDRLTKLVSILSPRVHTTKEEEYSLKKLNELSKGDIEYVKIKRVRIRKNIKNIPSYDLTPEKSKYFVAGDGNFTLVEDTMLDLLVNSLRMRPDRIVVGEIRREAEAQVLFEAMHTGHSVYSTVHADSMDETIKRLTNPPIKVPSNLLGAVNLNVVMFRDRRRALRRVFQVGEFIVSGESFGSIVKPNIMYRWKPETDTVVPHLKSVKFFEDLSRHTGMTEQEINRDLAEKKKILDLMAKKNIRSLEEVGKLMNQYYLEPDLVMKRLRK